MSTTTQNPPQPTPQAEQQHAPSEQPSRAQQREQRQQARQQRIDTAAQQLVNKLRTEERKRPPAERRSEAQLWQAARRQASKDDRSQRFKQQAKDTTRQAGRTTKAEAKSAFHRNRQQLAPWMLATPYAAAGAGGWAAAEFGSGHPIALSAAVAATALGASIMAWRKWLAKHAPTKFAERIKATLALLSVWATLMPLIPNAGQGGMWISMIVATAYMALPWWREHEHPLPLPTVPAPAASAAEESAPAEAPSAEQQFAQRILDDYHQHVATKNMLPGTSLANPQRTQYGFAFELALAQTGQTIDDARQITKKIASALDVDPESVLFDQDRRADASWRTLIMTIITDPVPNDYTGPTIVRDGGDVYLEVGPHSDGSGSEYFHVLSDQLTAEQLAAGEMPRGSMNGGFVFGTKGSGKSRFLELIATGLRALGIEIWYLDPQGGKSSPALMAEADWPLSGLHGDHAYSNVKDLLHAIDAVCEVREAEGGETEQGFQHTPQRPAIMVIIEECHEAFQPEDSDTEENFGVEFAHLDRKMRKNGIGLLGGSQSITQNTFGVGNDAGLLRSGMCAVNCFGLAYRANPGLAPGYDGQPVQALPLNRGYGYNLMGARPQLRFQARYTPDFQPWLQSYPRPVLDTRAQKRIGKVYQCRFDKAAQSQEAKQAWLDQLDSSEDASQLPRLGTHGSASDATSSSARPSRAQPTGSALPDLTSPSQLRQQAPQPDEDELTKAVTSAVQACPPDNGDPSARPTEAEQRVLELLTEQPAHTPASAAHALDVSVQAARKHLRRLAEKGHARKDTDGAYSTAGEAVTP